MADQIQQDRTAEEVLSALALPLVEELPDPIPVGTLANPAFLKTIEGVTREILRTDNSSDANELLKRLGTVSNVREQKPEIFKHYQEIITELKFLTLAGRRTDEITELFSTHLVQMLKRDHTVKDKLEMLFAIYPDTLEPTHIRTTILNSFLQNKEYVGEENKNIRVQSEATTLPAQVRYWLRDYARTTNNATAESADLRERTYLSSSENVKTLRQEDRKILQKVLEAFDTLRYAEIKDESIDRRLLEGGLETSSRQPVAEAAKQVPEQRAETNAGRTNDLDNTIRILMNKHNLRVDEVTALRSEITKVLAGLLHPSEFMGELRKKLPAMPEEKLQSVVASVDESVFSPIRKTFVRDTTESPSDLDGVRQHLEQETRGIKAEERVTDLPAEASAQVDKQPTTDDPYREPIE